MTDIFPWHRLIHVEKVRADDFRNEPVFLEYVMVPLKPYQMGNLIDAVAQVVDTGDWYGEFFDIMAVAMRKLALTKLSSNRGNVYTYEQVRARLGGSPRRFPLPED